MIDAGALENPKVDAAFGLHVMPGPVGVVRYRAGPLMASADNFRIVLHGRQTHGAMPWLGVDPVVVGSQIVLGLQTIVSRRTDLMKSPAVVSVSTINGGSRWNIVADSVTMTGTIRAYDAGVRAGIHRDIRQIAENIAASANAKAEVDIIQLYDPTVNNERVTARMVPVLERASGGDAVPNERSGAAEDVSVMLAEVPGLYFNLGIVPRNTDLAKAAPNHSPDFFIDESALVVGVRALAMVTVNYLTDPLGD
jgi:amidohydrolase